MASKIIVLNNKEVRWASVQKPKDGYQGGPKVYSVDVLLDKGEAKAFHNQGFNVKKDNEGNPFIQVKKYAEDENGDPKPKPIVVDKDAVSFNNLIGNGSICNIRFFANEYKPTGHPRVSAKLIGIQVVDLVPYETVGFDPVKDQEDNNGRNESEVTQSEEDDDELPF